MEITIYFIALVKTSFSLFACIPQYVLIYKLKTTKGFSIFAQVLDIIACLCAVLQIVIDYYVNGNNTGFWNELNYGKFLYT